MSLPIISDLECSGCGNRPAAWCSGCPAEKRGHHAFVDNRPPFDVLVVSDCQAPLMEGPTTYIREQRNPHHPYQDNAGKIVRAAENSIIEKNPNLRRVKVSYTYAARCTFEEMPRAVYDHCKNFLSNVVVAASAGRNSPLVVLAMGKESVKSLGVKAAKLADVQSRVIQNVEIAGRRITVIPTISAAQLSSQPGYYNVFERDFQRALEASQLADHSAVALEELTKDYVIPKTLEEVRTLVSEVLAYSDGKATAEHTPISVDTETNTKFPHRDGTRMLAVSFAWGYGKAAAVALWHKDVPYDPEKAAEIVRELVESSKPKVLHNLKYDLKVFEKYGWRLNNVAWDTMLGEHGLEEDKKGQYGLKQLTRALNPDFASYADELHAEQERLEGENQLENVRKQKAAVAEVDEPEFAKAKKSKAKKRSDAGGFENIPLGKLLRYAAVDADMTWRLGRSQLPRFAREEEGYKRQKQRVEPSKGQYAIPSLPKHRLPAKDALHTITLPAVPVLADMEFRGIRVDKEYLSTLDAALGEIIDKAERELHILAGPAELKLNSPASVANLLFNEGYIDPDTGSRVLHTPVSMTPTGLAQTTDKVLKALVAKSGCKFSAKKLIYAKAYKAKNTFVANVRDLSALDGYLHTNYNQHGTATYRLSSNDENMQNIPKKLAGYSIKKIFVPDDDSMLFVNADAKGAEVRIFTAYSRDKQLIRSINDGFDTHCFIGAEIVKAVRNDPGSAAEVLEAIGLDDQYPLTYEDFDQREKLKQNQLTAKYGEMLDKFRTAVKRVVFGILYGAAAPKIAETIGISEDQARQIIDLLFSLFPSIPEYMAQTKWELRTFRMVETYFGRRRRFSVEGAPRYMLSRAERQAINFKIQSTSSDIVIGCLTSIRNPLEEDLGGRLLLTVHDSIGFQVPKKYARQLPDFIDNYLVKQTAEKYPWLPVEFKWDFEVGPNYGEMQPLDAWLAKHKSEVLSDEISEAYDDDDIHDELRNPDAP